MKVMEITINYFEDIQEFVRKARDVDGTVLVYKGSYCVDGASLLGVLSLDTSKNISVKYPDNAVEFEDFLSKFKVRV